MRDYANDFQRFRVDLARLVGFRTPTFSKKSGFLAKLAQRVRHDSLDREANANDSES
jgi:hypothetical protein